MKNKASNKILSLILTVVMVFTMLPGVTVYAEDSGILGTSGVITAFDELAEGVAAQSVTLGTSLEALSLPETLTATITTGAGLSAETVGEDEATPTDADGQDDTDSVTLTITAQIPVTWQSEPEYDPDTIGTYVFTAEIPDEYTVAEGVTPPVITVQIRLTPSLRIVGVGTASNPLIITTAQQLYEFAQLVNSGGAVNGIAYSAMYVELGNDIDLSAYGENFDSGAGWTPIGTSSSLFTGSFDGVEHEITGLYINRSSSGSSGYNQGLFGCIDGGTVENLGIVDCDITGYVNVGGVAGYVENGSVTNCYVTGSISGTGSAVGGVAGQVSGSGSVTNCYSTATISGYYNVGGVIGSVYGSSVTNCYSTGSVGGNNRVGGVAGVVDGSGVTNCAALNGGVTASGSNAGRVAGSVSGSGTLSGNYAYDGMTVTVSGSAQGTTSSDTGTDGADITADTITTDGTLGDLFTDDDNPWTCDNGCLPGLFGNPVDIPAYIVPISTDYFAGGDGTSSEPYQIKTPAQLAKLAELVNAGATGYCESTVYYQLMNDLDLSDYGASYDSNTGWTPIGTGSNYFKGTFDGVGHEITGLYISRSSSNYQGLFGIIDGGTVKNLGVVDCNITGSSAVGGVAGEVYYGSVTNCYATGTVSGTSNVGGVAGRVYGSGSVENCYATGSVSGSDTVGGVAGSVSGGSVTNCYTTGAVSGATYVGGVAGYVFNGSVENCAALNPSVTASSNYAGRVVGSAGGSSTLTNNYAYDGMTVTVASASSTISDGTVTNKNGADITAAAIIDGSAFIGLFTDSVWTKRVGDLPGLFGATVDIPVHIQPFAGGDGTSGNPYQIKTPAQLAKLAELVNAGTTGYCESTVYYKLMNDLDLSAYQSGEGWTPIGTSSNYFKGSFDGGGHEITGLYISRSSGDYQGLFGFISEGTVENLGVADCAITGGSGVGGVAGLVYDGSVENCYATGSVSGNTYVGGVAGQVYDGSVENCYATGSVTGTGNSVGGVAGDVSYSSVENCYSTGSVTGTGNNVGGVAGQVSYSSVENCYATGSVTGTGHNVGGVAGLVYDGSVTNCYATGSVSGYNGVGGVAGLVSSNSSVTNCAALNGGVTATYSSAYAGRVAGSVSGTLSGNYAYSGMTVTVSGSTTTPSSTDATSLNGADITAAEIIDGTAFSGLFTDTAVWTTANGYLPGLFGANVDIPVHIQPFAGGDGTSGNPYQIQTPAQLAKLAELVNAGTAGYCESTVYYQLMNNLDLSAYNTSGGWTPIGTYSNGFKGIFDGGGYEITGLYISRSSGEYQGLFGYISGGTVKNLGVVDCAITGNNYVGGVAGYVYYGSVTNCYATGSVSGANYVGGVAGYVYYGSVTNCYATGAVSGNLFVGGVAGDVYSSSVTNCYATGAVSGYNSVGGVAGCVSSNSSVTNCAALNPSVTANTSNAGRVAGSVSGSGTLTDNYAYSGMTVSTDGGSTSSTITTGTATNLNGADITKAQIASPTFWDSAAADNTMGWDKDVWTFAQGYLPVLIGLAGQNGDMPIFLTAFPTDGLTVTVSGAGVASTGSTGAYSVPYSASDPRTFTISVTGMEGLTWTEVTVKIDDTAIAAGVTVAATGTNGSAEITVPAGYVGEITITSILTNDVENTTGAATLAVLSYTATVSPASHSFTAVYGYTQQTEQYFYIRSTGTGELTNVTAALSGGTYFEISWPLFDTTIVGNTLGTVGVRPKTGLAVGTYTDTLTITGDNGLSLAVSLSVTVTQASQTISGVSAMTKTYGDADFTINPSAPENPAFTFSSSNTGVATIASNGTITITGAGTATITVNAAATANYAAATTAFTLTVNKADNAITGLSAITATYGGNSVTVTPQANGSPTFSYSSSDINVAAVDANGVVTITGVGSAVITVTAAATANYNAATANFSVNVSQSGEQTISGLQDYDVIYGEANFTLSPSGSESPAFSFTSSNTNVAAVDANGVVTIVGAGTAVITVTAGATANYAGTSAVCVVTVDKAAQTISGLTNLTKTYGDGNFTVTPNSNAAAETPNISFQSSNTSVIDFDANENFVIAGIGTAAITVIADETTNYKSATETFDITVNQKQLTATYTAANKVYDGSTAASVTVTLIGVIAGDDVSATADGTFASASVGTGITVTVSNVQLTGSDAGNYIAPAAANTTANITSSGSSGGGSSTTYYTVTFNTNGGSTVSSKSIAKNETVTAPADPTKDDYSFTGWYTDAALTVEYDFSAKVTGSFTLYAGWEKNTEPKPDEPGETHAAYISGYPDGSFKPDSSMTRAEAATLFYNLLGGTAATGSGFTDVSSDAWYYDAVTALSGAGIISGYPDGTFGPDNTITRSEFITMAARFAGINPQTGATGFPDVSDTYWAAGYIAAAVNAGYISGYPDGSFGPDNQITRAEAVTILNKIRGCEGATEGTSFTDVPKSHWAYAAITAAATGHIH